MHEGAGMAGICVLCIGVDNIYHALFFFYVFGKIMNSSNQTPIILPKVNKTLYLMLTILAT